MQMTGRFYFGAIILGLLFTLMGCKIQQAHREDHADSMTDSLREYSIEDGYLTVFLPSQLNVEVSIKENYHGHEPSSTLFECDDFVMTAATSVTLPFRSILDEFVVRGSESYLIDLRNDEDRRRRANCTKKEWDERIDFLKTIQENDELFYRWLILHDGVGRYPRFRQIVLGSLITPFQHKGEFLLIRKENNKQKIINVVWFAKDSYGKVQNSLRGRLIGWEGFSDGRRDFNGMLFAQSRFVKGRTPVEMLQEIFYGHRATTK